VKRTLIPLIAIPTLMFIAPPATRIDAAPAGTEVTRKIYFSATDSKGTPVTDLKATEITVKEAGKEYPVAGLQAATAPMQVAILVDDGGTGALQAAVGQLLQKGLGHGQFAVSVLDPKATKLADFTADFAPLQKALSQLSARQRVKPDGDQLPEAILEAAKSLQQMKAERPVIVALTIVGASPQVVDPEYVLTTLRASGASLNVVGGSGAELGRIMNDGPKESGGRIEMGGTQTAMAQAATKIADALLGQYLLTYLLPDGVRMSDRLAVTTSRRGITLTAPTRIPDK